MPNKNRMPYVTEQLLAFEVLTINILLYGVRSSVRSAGDCPHTN